MTAHSVDFRPASAHADESSIDELDAAICTLARQMNAQTYRWLMLVREFDDRMGWAKWACRTCAEWLALRCQLSLSAAREHVRTAQALREMPSISAAFAEGRLSYSKVRALTRVVESHNEQKLLAYALEVTAAQLEERCREMRNGEPESVCGARRAWERRSLTLRRDVARGTMSISVEVPLDAGELIAQALERAVEAGEAASEHEFGTASRPPAVQDAAETRSAPGNGWYAQQADALVAVAKAYLCGGGEAVKGSAAADRYQVVVHVDESALRGGAGRSDLPIETVKRLCCDGSVISLEEDERGNPLDVGRKRRTVTTALRRALWSRDRGCIFPGCHRKRYVDGHHMRHWADGGETSLENIALLCSFHHLLVHEGGFRMARDANGEFYFQRPNGRVIPRGGYRLEDAVDDFPTDDVPIEYAPADPGLIDDSPIDDGRAAAATSAGASAEVREARAVYRVARRAFCIPM
ncbi:MAG: DUF222 domain-containing protein [Gammaproteobacteria bacterium]|nr:DUF222 domain-containing protein [Gammaproteobacteria bacterium]